MLSLSNSVIKNGFCIGCGVCTAIKDSPFLVRSNKFGMFEAANVANLKEPMLATFICPFSALENEDVLAEEFFDTNSLKHDIDVGYYSSLTAGFVGDNNYRLSSSSGGMVSWILEQLLTNKLVDGIIHIKKGNTKSPLFKYDISRNIDEVRQGKGSRYYPIELSNILELIKNSDEKYAIVGVPCFIKGVRLLKKYDSRYSNIIFFIGLVCGQLKSANYSNFIAKQLNVSKGSLLEINYREKDPYSSAAGYAYKLSYLKNNSILEILKKASSIYGNDWGMGMFKYKACDACDDVFNETADVVFGDAWLNQYLKDWLGTNIVITRSEVFDNIINKGVSDLFINLDKTNLQDIKNSQLANIKHRKQLIKYRLLRYKNQLDWVPEKRSYQNKYIPDRHTLKIQDLRMKISSKSHILFYQCQNIILFKLRMSPLYIRYKLLYYGFNIRFLLPSRFVKLLKYLLK